MASSCACRNSAGNMWFFLSSSHFRFFSRSVTLGSLLSLQPWQLDCDSFLISPPLCESTYFSNHYCNHLSDILVPQLEHGWGFKKNGELNKHIIRIKTSFFKKEKLFSWCCHNPMSDQSFLKSLLSYIHVPQLEHGLLSRRIQKQGNILVEERQVLFLELQQPQKWCPRQHPHHQLERLPHSQVWSS